MASFEREKNLFERLATRLGLDVRAAFDPKATASGAETGVDVGVRLKDGRTIGIQVTEVDPHVQRGKARADEKRAAKASHNGVYGGWGQNDPKVMLDAVTRSIVGKIKIANRHDFKGYDETWLLLCASIPESGAVISTIMMTPWISEADLGRDTGPVLQASKYTHCFLLPILGVEQAFYRWEKNGVWEKSVQLENTHDVPRAAYVGNLSKAAAEGNWGEVGRLCDAECKNVLSEMRQMGNNDRNHD